MALIKCNECGKEFSDKANACPNCACPIEKIKIREKTTETISKNTLKNKKQIIIITGVIIFVLIPVIISLTIQPKLDGTYFRENDVYSRYITLYEYGDCEWSTYSGENLIWEYNDGYVLIKTVENPNENIGVCTYKNKTLNCEDKASNGTGTGTYILE